MFFTVSTHAAACATRRRRRAPDDDASSCATYRRRNLEFCEGNERVATVLLSRDISMLLVLLTPPKFQVNLLPGSTSLMASDTARGPAPAPRVRVARLQRAARALVLPHHGSCEPYTIEECPVHGPPQPLDGSQGDHIVRGKRPELVRWSPCRSRDLGAAGLRQLAQLRGGAVLGRE
jgi:hypothetical protein